MDPFKNDTQTNSVGDTQPTEDQTEAFAKLSAMTRDDGTPKYASLSQAMDALIHSQSHISTLERETAERDVIFNSMSDELKAKEDLAQQLADLKTKATKEVQDQVPNKEGLSENDVADLISKQMESARQTEVRNANLNGIVDQLVSKFGDKSGEYVANVAKQNGMDSKQLRELCETNPTLSSKLLFPTGESPVNPNFSQFSAPPIVNDPNPKPTFDKSPYRVIRLSSYGMLG